MPRVRTLAPGRPLLAAGAITDAADARDARDAQAYGTDTAVARSRFLLTHECHAHPADQQRVIEATPTVRTRLFGLGCATRTGWSRTPWCAGGATTTAVNVRSRRR